MTVASLQRFSNPTAKKEKMSKSLKLPRLARAASVALAASAVLISPLAAGQASAVNGYFQVSIQCPVLASESYSPTPGSITYHEYRLTPSISVTATGAAGSGSASGACPSSGASQRIYINVVVPKGANYTLDANVSGLGKFQNPRAPYPIPATITITSFAATPGGSGTGTSRTVRDGANALGSGFNIG
ncbi:hypothetical protein [Lentzea sp. HUAS12]|uniref:hypothetical protein n=1 Tax=Lentzea sp. HUAS12 TaxID=2951806 RepID=UPI00209EC6E1|nr:hypothetical protein [Lentzea sp. HUAS12]USX56361.1 hypothetical protein ND450_20340 [Lentzea sp. HUAS12]